MRWTATLLCLLALSVPAEALAQATGRIVGTVRESQTAQPLEGVRVMIEGTSMTALTGPNGQYALNGVGLGDHVVRTDMLGYATATQSVRVAAGDAATANFGLVPAAISLEGIVAIGYGTVQRRELTGAVASVGGEELRKVPSANVIESLQGKLPGVDITRGSGSANSGTDLVVRGTRSLTASNNPLVIIDGVQFGSLQDLNVNDLESIEILKDAAATAIYGSRGANGVILATTRRGSVGGTSVSINSYAGMTEITGYPRINTGPEYIAQKREANRTSGTWSSPADDAKIFTPTELANITSGVWTDFRDLLFHDGRTQSHQVGLSTGGENTRAYLSLGLFNEKGILRSDELMRYALRLNLEHALGTQWKIGTNSQITYYDRDRRRNPLNIANKINPLTTAFDDEGNLIIYPNNGRDISPLADEQPNAFMDNELQTFVVPSLFAEFAPIQGLTIRSTLGGSLTNRRRGMFQSPNTIDQNGSASAATYTTYNSRSVSFENVLTYRRDIGDHSLNVTGVASYLGNRNDQSSVVGRNQLLSSQLFYGLANAKEGIGITSGYEENSLLSYAGRVNYDLRDRYLLSVTGRVDGSSRLSPGNKWAFFPAVAAAWRVSEEPFLQDATFLNELKLRVSYGVSGNDAVAPYSTQASLDGIPFSFGETLAPGYTFSNRIGNADLKWELSKTTNLGIDAVLWNQRVSASVDVYQTNTSDLLLERFLPLTSGVSAVIQNIGATRNRGIELSLTTNNVQSNSFSWLSNLTFFKNEEEIVELVSGTDDIANGWFIGHPTAVFYNYEKIGIWQTDEAEEAARFGQQPGEIKVRDQNGDGEITATDDRIVLGSPRPDWNAGFTNNFTYKSFDFTATVFARMGQKMQYELYDTYKPDGVENGSAVDYWTPENPSNAFPRPNARFPKTNYLYYSSLTYADASFIKLRDATVGFTLPETALRRLGVGRARLYLTARNLARWTKVDDYDPERGGALSDPMTRLFITGVDISF